MDSLSTIPIVINNTQVARKRNINKECNKRNIAQRNRYKQKKSPQLPKCKHSKNGGFKCYTVSSSDAMSFAKGFYSIKSKLSQDSYILAYTSALKPTRKRNQIQKRKVSINYFLRKSNKSLIKVCQKTFCGILAIGKDRVINVAKRHLA